MLKQKQPLPIDELPIFKGLKAPEIHSLIEGSIATTTRHRGVLFKSGEPATHFALVLQGAYKLVRSDAAGHEAIMFFAGPGDTIGGLVMSKENNVYPVNVISIGSSMVLKIPRETFRKSWATNPMLQQKINAILYQRMSRIQQEKAQQRLPLANRVADLVVVLLEKYSNASEHILPIPITRQEIADSVGSTVESVIRLMSEWSAQGIVRTEDRHIEVLDLENLIEIAKHEGDT